MSGFTVYLIHIDQPIGHERTPEERAERGLPPRREGWRSTAQHYIGWTHDLDNRLHEHATGQGSSLLWYATQHGIGWNVVRQEPGDYHVEKYIKSRREAPKFCPVCNPRTWMNYKFTPQKKGPDK